MLTLELEPVLSLVLEPILILVLMVVTAGKRFQ